MSPAGFDHGAVIMNLDGAPLPPGFRLPVEDIFAL